eukprot:9014169-Pyramimonas_sp.AAC.1
MEEAGHCKARMSGQTGAALPPTSGAAEHLALAISHMYPNITKVHSDHLGAIRKYSQAGFGRKNMYSGLELVAKGKHTGGALPQ